MYDDFVYCDVTIEGGHMALNDSASVVLMQTGDGHTKFTQ